MPYKKEISRAEQIERGNEAIKEAVNKNSDDDSEDMDSPADDIPAVVLERQEIPMPEISPGSEYLVAFLHSAGTASASGMGITGLSWTELDAWLRCTDNAGIVTPRDMQIIHTLSRVYANEYSKAGLKGAKAPYSPVVENIVEVREVISQKADDLFGGMFAAQMKGGG